MTVKDPKHMTLNLPPLEETRDPEYNVNCCNWRNWLAFLLATIIVVLAYHVATRENEWIDGPLEWLNMRLSSGRRLGRY